MLHRSFNSLLTALSCLVLVGAAARAATCYGNDPCNACHTCGYCKHCNSGGNPCGVLRAERGQGRSSMNTHRTKIIHGSKSDHPKALDAVVPSTFFSRPGVTLTRSSHRQYKNDLHDLGVASPANTLPEPSPVPVRTLINSPIDNGRDSSPVVTGPPCIWQLSVTPTNVSGMPESLVGFRHWTDMQKPGLVESWDNWAKRLMHLIYANLTLEQGERSLFETCVIYVRADQKIMLSMEVSSNSKNMERLKRAVERLNGCPELVFPTQLQSDTVNITGQLAFAPVRVSRDVWGRVEPAVESSRNRYSW